MTETLKLREAFWELPLESLNQAEWEALCDGCGRCCLKKFIGEDSEEILWTRVVCRYFRESDNRCTCYGQRSERVPDCLQVRDMTSDQVHWMPPTCAYRLRWENRPLFPWHPLLSGDANSVRRSGIAINGRVLSEEYVHPDGMEEHVIRWVDAQAVEAGDD
jgi:uncharacterized cysteine cluster protein YcgN (CxxCxxCC family)